MKSGVQMMSINCSSTTLVSIVEVKLRRLTCQEKLATWIVLHLGMENPTINKTSHGSGRTLVSVQFSRGKHFGPNLAPANVLSKCATLAPPDHRLEFSVEISRICPGDLGSPLLCHLDIIW